KVIGAPSLTTGVQARHILLSSNVVNRERVRVAKNLRIPRQIGPERHVEHGTAGCCQFIQLWVRNNDSGLNQRGKLCGPLDQVRVKYFGYDNIRNASRCESLKVELKTEFAHL